ncbi:MAG: carbon-nitrogen hydrolase family protein [Defluviitaleaceae bacterium]|nr:carbon-nitrogen hydrolase family protein [Defluviitaleaceae bacterium]
MKAAICVPKIIEHNIAANLDIVLKYIDKAALAGADLMLFPEAVLTGIDICDNYDKDKLLALSIASPEIQQIINKSQMCNIWVALGFIEIDNNCLYDTAILIDNFGAIQLHQRRLSRGWCDDNADKTKYGYGGEFLTADTIFGKIGFMICGDLFNVPHLAKNANLDLLLFPFARCFGSQAKLPPQREWDENELPEYSRQIAEIGAPALGANYITPGKSSYFGGAFATDANGDLIASLPLYQEGLLLKELTICK